MCAQTILIPKQGSYYLFWHPSVYLLAICLHNVSCVIFAGFKEQTKNIDKALICFNVLVTPIYQRLLELVHLHGHSAPKIINILLSSTAWETNW